MWLNHSLFPVFFGEEAEELRVNLVDDSAEVLGVLLKIHLVALDDQHPTLVLMEDEVLVTLVEVFQVIELHALLVVATTLLNLRDERRHGFAEVDHQVRELHHPLHVLEQLHVRLIVAVAEVAAAVVVRYEHVHALEDTPVLNDGVRRGVDHHHVLEALLEEVCLQAERPAFDVGVVVLQVRVEAHALEARFPAVVLRQHLRQRRLACTDISSYRDVHGVIYDLIIYDLPLRVLCHTVSYLLHDVTLLNRHVLGHVLAPDCGLAGQHLQPEASHQISPAGETQMVAVAAERVAELGGTGFLHRHAAGDKAVKMMALEHHIVAAANLVVHVLLVAVVVRLERRMSGILLIRPGHVPVELRLRQYMQFDAIHELRKERLVGEPLSDIVAGLLHRDHIPLIGLQSTEDRHLFGDDAFELAGLLVATHEAIGVSSTVPADVQRMALQRAAANIQIADSQVDTTLRSQLHEVVLNRIDGEAVAYTKHLQLTWHRPR